MSTLGRETMRKTLKRLKNDAYDIIDEFLDSHRKLRKSLNREGHLLSIDALDAIDACIRYIETLEDYGYELDKKWDKLLKSIEQTKESKPVQRKEETKKTSYIK